MVTNEQQPMLRFLIVQTAASVVGLQCEMILFNNFAVEIAGLDVTQICIIDSVREIPRFLARLKRPLGIGSRDRILFVTSDRTD